jgi:hypothetical protein
LDLPDTLPGKTTGGGKRVIRGTMVCSPKTGPANKGDSG